ncbi:putative chromatin remodeling complex subunit (Arp9) [Aspergillus clavatus NRRL 1]|uniref:Chromatin remodeling complex subunit (Arp9), putative n=1 Tax=Aspergillus clavatus (strain ATCC 1007 / CBS 513.65 / DSM 816 / NCTC 3887 / NRRL 1 / QM 1276 / 107) TaxID=344612 RepID=A1CCH7_ASPCL|nr:chromatin remodeling complex subunit (Arp9), putative [Aspergillus clavatus NRRL 1]EAW12234.1 chromatin remodeling complex subunit (Arp9), putative [Aspergillus clavatus NRRL 1]
MPPFKDEHILIIAPGSQVTLAQLGLPESFTPARFRFPTRMFPGEKKGEYEPYKIQERRRDVKANNGADAPKEDVEMKDAEPSVPEGTPKPETAEKPEKPDDAETGEKPQAGSGQEGNRETAQETAQEPAQDIVYEEDVTSDEGAVYPIENGRIVDWPCFFALLTHVHNTLSPPFHTPIMLISEPVWSARDREAITQFVFEKFKTPAFCLMDSALAICYGYGTSTATVIDVGKDKVDVTAVTDFMVNEHGRGVALEGCGGDYMTDRLWELLRSKGFTREMCEQLKRSNITEILPPGVPLPGTAATAQQGANPAPSTSISAQESAAPNGSVPRGPGENIQTGPEGTNAEGEEDEGVLDVAAIVSGNTSEFLAKRDKERAEKASKKSAADQAAKPVRLPNSKKEKASFQFEEFVRLDSEKEKVDGPRRFIRHKRDIEVGIERFLSATPKEQVGERLSSGILEDIATQIHHTILAVPDAAKRSELWDSLIVVGNGSKIKGFTQALLGAITQKFILSPSGTMFTSEIPSNFSTPLPTGGTNTPAPSGQPGPMHHPAGHGVNPLLVAATHSGNPAVGNMPPGTPSLDPSSLHHRSTGHSQTPTSVKTLRPPEYFPEWKEQSNSNAPGASGAGALGMGNGTAGRPSGASTGGHGMEEAVFLGAQVASKVIFVLDQGLSKGFMSRVEYNENGPSAIHEYAM